MNHDCCHCKLTFSKKIIDDENHLFYQAASCFALSRLDTFTHMNSHLHLSYADSELTELIALISESYYDRIIDLSENTREYLNHISGLLDVTLYQVHYAGIENELQQFVKLRKEIFIPYIFELFDKSTSGHNCSQCSGRCDVQHGLKTYEFNSSLQHIKQVTSSIKSGLPALVHAPYDGQVKVLHNEVNLLYNMLIDLWNIERNILLPKIEEAQKKINARS